MQLGIIIATVAWVWTSGKVSGANVVELDQFNT